MQILFTWSSNLYMNIVQDLKSGTYVMVLLIEASKCVYQICVCLCIKTSKIFYNVMLFPDKWKVHSILILKMWILILRMWINATLFGKRTNRIMKM